MDSQRLIAYMTIPAMSNAAVKQDSKEEEYAKLGTVERPITVDDAYYWLNAEPKDEEEEHDPVQVYVVYPDAGIAPLQKKQFTKHKIHYQCTDCDETFPSTKKLDTHKMTCHNSTSALQPVIYKCQYCNESFESQKKLTQHMKMAQHSRKNLPFECSLCDKSYGQKHMLLKHMKWHSDQGVKSVTCKHCRRVFRSITGLRVHMRVNFQEGCLTCDLCGKTFNYVCALSAHKKRFHCKHCLKVFTSPSLRREHELDVHGKNFPCSHCKKRFPTNERLSDHMNVHQGISSHSCFFCKRLFMYKTMVLKHIKSCTHRSFPCSLCGRRYMTAAELQDHRQKIHQLERMFGCNCCPEAFKTKEEHEAHLKVHTDMKPYYCDICVRWYLYESTFKNHEKVLHVV